MKKLGWIGLTLLAFWLTACQNTSFSKGQQGTTSTSTPPVGPPPPHGPPPPPPPIVTPPPYNPPPIVTPPPYYPPPIVTPPPYYPPPIVTPPPYNPPPIVTPPPFTPPVTPPPYNPPPIVTPPPYNPPPIVTPPPYNPPPIVTPPPYNPPPVVTPPPYNPPPVVTPPPTVTPPTTPPGYPPAPPPPPPQGGVNPPPPVGGGVPPVSNSGSVMLPSGGQPTSVPWTSLPQNNMQAQVSQGAPAPVEVPAETPMPITEPSVAPVPSEGPVTPPPTHTCQPTTIERRKTDKLDILFVVDSSDSLKSERTRIVSQMNNFIKSLDPKTDYQIGVVLAHAPGDREYPCVYKDKNGNENKRKCDFARAHISQNKMGQLYTTGKGDPAVLKYSEIRNTSKLINMLEKKMANPPEDYSPAQGELGLYNTYRIMTEDNLKQAMVAQGMFRQDAVLAVFFISDEQDICYNYKELNPNVKPAFEAKNGKLPWSQADLSKDVNGRDPVEQWAYENICNIGKNGKPLQYYDVAAAAKDFARAQGMKSVIFSGAVFWNNDTIPRCFPDKSRRQNCKSGKIDNYADEKEIGYGYTDLIRTTHMSPVDLASDDFGAQMTNLGLQTSAEMLGSSTVDCSITDGSDDVIRLADKHSFKVELQDANGHITTVDSSGADASLYAVPETDADGRHLRIVLPREKVKKILEHGNATARISFSEVRDGEQGGLIQAVKRIKFFRPHLKANAKKADAAPAPAPQPAPVAPPAVHKQASVKADKAEKHVEKKTAKKAAVKKSAKVPETQASADPIQALKNIFSDSEKQNAKVTGTAKAKKKSTHKKQVQHDDDDSN